MNFDSKKKVTYYWKKFQIEKNRTALASTLIDGKYWETRALEPTFQNLTSREREEMLELISDLQKYLNRQKNYLSKISKELRKS